MIAIYNNLNMIAIYNNLLIIDWKYDILNQYV